MEILIRNSDNLVVNRKLPHRSSFAHSDAIVRAKAGQRDNAIAHISLRAFRLIAKPLTHTSRIPVNGNVVENFEHYQLDGRSELCNAAPRALRTKNSLFIGLSTPNACVHVSIYTYRLQVRRERRKWACTRAPLFGSGAADECN